MKVTYPGSVENVVAFFHLPRSVRRAAKAQLGRRPPTPSSRWMWAALISLIVAGLLLLAGGVQLLLAGKLFGGVPAGMVVIFAALFSWQMRPAARRRTLIEQWKAERHPEAPITVEIDDAGFHYLNADIDRHIPWPAVGVVYESDTHIFVEDRQPMVYMIPKKAFASDADRKSFCDEIRSRIASNKPTAA